MNEADKAIDEAEKKLKESRRLAEYYVKNKARLRASNAKWKAENKARLKSYSAGYYLRNKEKIKAAAARWQLANKDKVKVRKAASTIARRALRLASRPETYYSKWHCKNREAVSERQAKWYVENGHIRRDAANRRRAMAESGTCSNDPQIAKWDKSWRNGGLPVRCYWCQGLFQPNKCHTDHIIALSNGGLHRIDNLCIACASCNTRKRNKDISTWNSQIVSPVLLI